MFNNMGGSQQSSYNRQNMGNQGGYSRQNFGGGMPGSMPIR